MLVECLIKKKIIYILLLNIKLLKSIPCTLREEITLTTLSYLKYKKEFQMNLLTK